MAKSQSNLLVFRGCCTIRKYKENRCQGCQKWIQIYTIALTSERNLQTCADLEATKSQGHVRPPSHKSLLLSPVVRLILNSMTQNAAQALVLVFMQTEYIYYITPTFSSHGGWILLMLFSFWFLNSLLSSPLWNYSWQDDGVTLCHRPSRLLSLLWVIIAREADCPKACR